MPAESILTILLGMLGQAIPARRAVNAVKSSMLAGGILLLGGMAAIAALGFGCAALWAFEQSIRGPVQASLMLAGTLLMVALTLGFLAWLVHRNGTKPAPSGMPPEQIAAILKTMGDLVGDHKTGTLIAAVLAGVAAEQATRRRWRG